MSQENARHYTCGLCSGRIDEVKDFGLIRWNHCEECGAWSAFILHIENFKDHSISTAGISGRENQPI
jgi:hypothetical protein